MRERGQGFSTTFDASLEELWLALAAGAALVPCPDAVLRSPDAALPAFLAAQAVTVLSTVPTLLGMLDPAAAALPRLRLLILGGEACPQDLLARWSRPGRRLVNSYGPTVRTAPSERNPPPKNRRSNIFSPPSARIEAPSIPLSTPEVML